MRMHKIRGRMHKLCGQRYGVALKTVILHDKSYSIDENERRNFWNEILNTFTLAARTLLSSETHTSV